MWAFELSIRFGKDKGVDEVPGMEYIDVSSAQVELAPKPLGFTPNEGWEDKR